MLELLDLQKRYGNDVVGDQLKKAIGKCWQSIEVDKYKQFNKVETSPENSESSADEDKKRRENMLLHAKNLGAKSVWMNDDKYSEQYEEVLKSISS